LRGPECDGREKSFVGEKKNRNPLQQRWKRRGTYKRIRDPITIGKEEGI